MHPIQAILYFIAIAYAAVFAFYFIVNAVKFLSSKVSIIWDHYFGKEEEPEPMDKKAFIKHATMPTSPQRPTKHGQLKKSKTPIVPLDAKKKFNRLVEQGILKKSVKFTDWVRSQPGQPLSTPLELIEDN